MTPLGSSVSDATIWSITVESSIVILEASFTLSYDVYSTDVTYDDHQIDNCNIFIAQTTLLYKETVSFLTHSGSMSRFILLSRLNKLERFSVQIF